MLCLNFKDFERFFMAVIRCRNCNYQEEANKEFFFKVLGGGLVGGGYWAWVTYFFAGKGCGFDGYFPVGNALKTAIKSRCVHFDG